MRTPGPQIGLLDQVLGIVHRAHHPVAVRQQLPPERVGRPHELLTGGHFLNLAGHSSGSFRNRYEPTSVASVTTGGSITRSLAPRWNSAKATDRLSGLVSPSTTATCTKLTPPATPNVA